MPTPLQILLDPVSLYILSIVPGPHCVGSILPRPEIACYPFLADQRNSRFFLFSFTRPLTYRSLTANGCLRFSLLIFQK